MNKIHVNSPEEQYEHFKIRNSRESGGVGQPYKSGRRPRCTQSAVSHTINNLEAELGFSVITRSRAGVKLTADGERIMPSVRGMLNYEEQLRQTASAIRGLDSGTVRIGAFTSVAVTGCPA